MRLNPDVRWPHREPNAILEAEVKLWSLEWLFLVDVGSGESHCLGPRTTQVHGCWRSLNPHRDDEEGTLKSLERQTPFTPGPVFEKEPLKRGPTRNSAISLPKDA